MRRFLYDQLRPDAIVSGFDVPLEQCPPLRGRVYIFLSAIAMFYAPSDPSGIGGMYCERIRATPSWHSGPPRNDCVLVTNDLAVEGMQGLNVGRIQFFFSFTHEGERYPCALIQWFSLVGNVPCEETGMWIVEPDLDHTGRPVQSVIHLETIVRGVLLVPVYGEEFIPSHITFSNSLGAFGAYYVNKYADHHANEILF